MKKLRSALVLLLVFSLVFSLAGCGKKAIDSEDFEDILYELGFDVSEGSPYDRSVREEWYAYNEDDGLMASYQRYRNEEAALTAFEEYLEEVEYDAEDELFSGTFKDSGRGNSRRLVVDGEFEDSWGDTYRQYIVVILIDDVIIMVAADGNRKSDKDGADEIVKELGY